MKCPVCQAKMMPVDGQMFCLQCGELTNTAPGDDKTGPAIEDTTDPVLQRAIVDSLQREVHFRLPVTVTESLPSKTTAFSSMRAVLAPPRSVLMGGAGGVAVAPVGVAASPDVKPAGGASVKEAAVVKTVVAPVAAAAVPKVGGVAVAAIAPAQPAAAGPVEAPKVGPNNLNLLQGKLKRRWHISLRGLPLAWAAGAAGFVVFLLVNGGLLSYYADRVYPGVQVSGVELGGTPLASVEAKLRASLAEPKLTIDAGSVRYPVDTKALGGPDVAAMAREAATLGHDTPLPLAGVIWSMTSKPLEARWQVNDKALNSLTAELSRRFAHASSNAVPVIVNGKAFVISEKAGVQLDEKKVAEAIRAAYGNQTSLNLDASKTQPLVTAGAYQGDIQEAQARMVLGLKLTRKAAVYSPTAEQIGSWLVFGGVGKGVGVDAAGVAAYVGSIPGSFDRVNAANVLAAAISSKQNLNYALVTKKITSAPKPASIAAAWPLASYTYCTQDDAASNDQGLASRIEQALGGASGWGLGGRLKFVRSTKGCNFNLALTPAGSMSLVSAACDGKSTCEAGSLLAINSANWETLPKGWKGGLDGYQIDLISHVVGHWLGFDHASCASSAGATPILEEPTVVLGGCSPKWYALAPEVQSVKRLNEF